MLGVFGARIRLEANPARNRKFGIHPEKLSRFPFGQIDLAELSKRGRAPNPTRMHLPTPNRVLLVVGHQPRISENVGSKNG